MFKKAMPLIFSVGLLALAGCTNNNAVPNNNETPMENLEDRARDVEPRVDDRTGPNMDGIDENNGVNDGVINNERNGTINENDPLAPNTDRPVDENTNPAMDGKDEKNRQPNDNNRKNR